MAVEIRTIIFESFESDKGSNWVHSLTMETNCPISKSYFLAQVTFLLTLPLNPINVDETLGVACGLKYLETYFL